MSVYDAFFGRWPGLNLQVLAPEHRGTDVYRQSSIITTMWQGVTGSTITLETVPLDIYDQQVAHALAENTADLVLVPAPWLPWLASQRWLAPLDPLVAESGPAWAAYADRANHPALYSELNFEQTRYLIPAFAEVQIVAYRQDWIDRIGAKPVPVPITLQRLLELVEGLHASPDYTGAWIGQSSHDAMGAWLSLFFSSGGVLADATDQIGLNSDAGRRSLSMLRDLPKVPSKEGPGSDQIFSDKPGSPGLCLLWSSEAHDVLSPEMTACFDRLGYTCLERSAGWSWSFAINSRSENPLQALAFALWATSKDNDRLQGMRSGAPVRVTTFSNAAGRNACPWYEVLSEALDRKPGLPGAVWMPAALMTLSTMVSKVLESSLQIDRALSLAEEELALIQQQTGITE